MKGYQDALQRTEPDSSSRTILLNNLSNALRILFERTGSIEDLNSAETLIREVVENGAPESGALRNLSIVLQCQFRQKGNTNHLLEAISVSKEAILLDSTGANLCNLGNALHEKYRKLGNVDDLTEALRVMEAASAIAEDSSSRALYLSNFSLILKTEFERTESADVLDGSVNAIMEASALTPENHPHKPMYLNNLNHAFQVRFDRTHSTEDLNAAHQAISLALQLIPDNSPYRALYLNNLGTLLRTRYEVENSVDDIRAAVEALIEANNITPHEHSDKSMYLYNLSGAAQDLFDETEIVEALNVAVDAGKLAVNLSSDDDIDQVEQLRTLGNALYRLFETTGSKEHFQEAIAAYERSVELVNAPPSSRIRSARTCADLLYSEKAICDASRFLSLAVHLLPAISPRTLRRRDQQTSLSKFFGLAGDACALSVEAGEDIYKSLQLLEVGRGVMDGIHWEMRSEISALNDAHPQLAEKFKLHRANMEESVRSQGALHSQITEKDKASSQFEETLNTIRAIPAFRTFLLGPTVDELKTLASQGPLVFINVSEFGSDAFIITCDEVIHLSLTELHFEDVESKSKAFVEKLEDLTIPARSLNSWMKRMLEWLWDVAIEHILRRLGFNEMPENEELWPHVWWIPVGRLNIFPIHAAGYHSIPAQNVIDRVISSYTSTARALQQARNRAEKGLSPKERQTVLFAGMVSTSKRCDLPDSEHEIMGINNILPSSIVREILLSPTKQDIVEKVGQCSIAHFACHGEVTLDPSKSRLLFSDWETRPFTVADMSEIKLDKAEFAYLSACHTAYNGNFALLDEGIHMAKAFQLAGFPTVVGTLWQIPDKDSAGVAKDVYRGMLNGNKLEVLKAGKALHFAVRKVRDCVGQDRGGQTN